MHRLRALANLQDAPTLVADRYRQGRTVTEMKMTRFDAELYRAATAAGKRESRSTQQQLAHWARLGKNLSDRTSVPARRVAAALAGSLLTAELSAEEGIAFDAAVDTAITERMADIDLARTVADEGIRAVFLDEEGELVTFAPDGTTRPVDDVH